MKQFVHQICSSDILKQTTENSTVQSVVCRLLAHVIFFQIWATLFFSQQKKQFVMRKNMQSKLLNISAEYQSNYLS